MNSKQHVSKRFTLNQLRKAIIYGDDSWSERYTHFLEQKAITEQAFLECQKTDDDIRAYEKEVELLDQKISGFEKAAEERLKQMLLKEEVIAFGVAAPPVADSKAIRIPSEQWNMMQLDIENSAASCEGLRYVGLYAYHANECPKEDFVQAKETKEVVEKESEVEVAHMELLSRIEHEGHYISDYMLLMLEAVEELSIDPKKPPYKQDVTDWIENRAKEKGITLSNNIVKAMGQLIRPPEAQKGGNRKVKNTPPKG